MKLKIKNQTKWFLIGICAVLIAAPNATIIKQTTLSIDAITFNVLRFGILAVVALPIIAVQRKRVTKHGLKQSLMVGLFMSVAVISYVTAIKLSQASYVSIISLLIPIFFMFYAFLIDKEKITRRSIAGITLAALGAFVVVFFPIALHQNAGLTFYPLATVLALINALSFPLAMIYSKRAHETGMPMAALFGVSSQVIFFVSITVLLISGGNFEGVQTGSWLSAAYSGLFVALLSRMLGVASYEHVGSAINGALSYLEVLLAILVPIFVLGEQISIELVGGGALILLGVYVVEHHKLSYHKHLQFFRHH